MIKDLLYITRALKTVAMIRKVILMDVLSEFRVPCF